MLEMSVPKIMYFGQCGGVPFDARWLLAEKVLLVSAVNRNTVGASLFHLLKTFALFVKSRQEFIKPMAYSFSQVLVKEIAMCRTETRFGRQDGLP